MDAEPWMPVSFKNVTREILSGTLTAGALWGAAAFLSPPLPLHHPWCATGWNDPAGLVLAAFLLVVRYGVRRWLVEVRVPRLVWKDGRYERL